MRRLITLELTANNEIAGFKLTGNRLVLVGLEQSAVLKMVTLFGTRVMFNGERLTNSEHRAAALACDGLSSETAINAALAMIDGPRSRAAMLVM